jgi:glycosyltransferase involved in cell wall biosynthesis
MDKVSVIMPFYNSERYIGSAVESFHNQTWPNKELILIDDASSDCSLSVLQRYLSDEVKLLRNDNNHGVAYSRNRGIGAASGQYIALLDSDDLMDREKLERQVLFLGNNAEYDVVFTDTCLIDERDEVLLRTRAEYNSAMAFLPMMLCRNVISPAPASCMYKRACFLEHAYNENLHYAEDYDLNLRLAFHYKFAYLDQPLYLYRRHTENASNRHAKHLENELRIVSQFSEGEIAEAFSTENCSEVERDYIRLLHGIFEIKRQRYRSSIRLLSDLRASVTDIRRSVCFYRGVAHYRCGELDLALQQFQSAMAYGVKAELLNNVGVMLALSQKTEEAIGLFDSAIQANPEYQDAQHNKDRALSGNGDLTGLRLTERELRRSLLPYR